MYSMRYNFDIVELPAAEHVAATEVIVGTAGVGN